MTNPSKTRSRKKMIFGRVLDQFLGFLGVPLPGQKGSFLERNLPENNLLERNLPENLLKRKEAQQKRKRQLRKVIMQEKVRCREGSMQEKCSARQGAVQFRIPTRCGRERPGADFGRFWGPLKIQGGAKNGPKNSIRRLFGTQGRPRGAQKSSWEGSTKTHGFLMEIWTENGGLEGPDHQFQ